MLFEPRICFLYELFVESFFTCSRFVSCHKQDGVAFRIKGECNAPDSIGCIEA